MPDKSIFQKLVQNTKFGKLLYGEPETYIDGYGITRNVDPKFSESADGQELKRMGTNR